VHAGAAPWETGRIGAGTPPVRTEAGWLEIYHGNAKAHGERGVGVYSAGALLLDLDDPQRVIAQTAEPVIVPEADFERDGFVPNVVFPTGIIERDDTYLIYYGAADSAVGVVEVAQRALLRALA
jgi:predicted GH43/DUF377 family glycosyl hydrolase